MTNLNDSSNITEYKETITDKYVFFWNGIYSQWHAAEIKIGNKIYNCCEQAMMYKKAIFFNDFKIADEIMKTDHPVEQKKLGRQVKNFNKDEWDQVCFQIVYEGNYAKFTQHEDLKQQLLATQDRIIVEASPYDRIWGIGLKEDDSRIHNPATWRGLNLLGFAITLVKQELLKQ